MNDSGARGGCGGRDGGGAEVLNWVLNRVLNCEVLNRVRAERWARAHFQDVFASDA